MCIFWSQQMKSATVSSSKGRRWHPLVIKWCLYIQHIVWEKGNKNKACIYVYSSQLLAFREIPLIKLANLLMQELIHK